MQPGDRHACKFRCFNPSKGSSRAVAAAGLHPLVPNRQSRAHEVLMCSVIMNGAQAQGADVQTMLVRLVRRAANSGGCHTPQTRGSHGVPPQRASRSSCAGYVVLCMVAHVK